MAQPDYSATQPLLSHKERIPDKPVPGPAPDRSDQNAARYFSGYGATATGGAGAFGVEDFSGGADSPYESKVDSKAAKDKKNKMMFVQPCDLAPERSEPCDVGNRAPEHDSRIRVRIVDGVPVPVPQEPVTNHDPPTFPPGPPVHSNERPESFFHPRPPLPPNPEPPFHNPGPPNPRPIFHNPGPPNPRPIFHNPRLPNPRPIFHNPGPPNPEPPFHNPGPPNPEPPFHNPGPPNPEPPFHNPGPPNPEPPFHNPGPPNPEPPFNNPGPPNPSPFQNPGPNPGPPFHNPGPPNPGPPFQNPAPQPVVHQPQPAPVLVVHPVYQSSVDENYEYTSYDCGGSCHRNHLFIATMFVVCGVVCLNMSFLPCAVAACIYSLKTAESNKHSRTEEAKHYYKKARKCNITVAILLVVGVIVINIIVITTFVTVRTIEFQKSGAGSTD